MPVEMNASPIETTDLRFQVAEIIRFLHAKGWTPATSSNFSCRLPGPSARSANAAATTADQTTTTAGKTSGRGFHISMSGLDKGDIRAEHFMAVDYDGKALDPTQAHLRPSAETLLHSVVYRLYSKENVILHTHSVNGTVLSKLYEIQRGIMLQNFEILKAFEGIQTHDCALWLPIFPNAQDMAALSAQIESELQAHSPVYGFLLAGHGLYTWGETPAQAKRHVEAFEFLFECILRLKSYGYSDDSR